VSKEKKKMAPLMSGDMETNGISSTKKDDLESKENLWYAFNVCEDFSETALSFKQTDSG